MLRAIIATSIVLTFASFSQAAVIVDWNLDTVNHPFYPDETPQNTPFDGVSASVADVATNLTVSDLVTDGAGGLEWNKSGSTLGGELNLLGWSNNSNNPVNWIQFDLTADPGFQYNITSLTIAGYRNGNGAAPRWAFQYSTDNGANWTAFGATHNETGTGGPFNTVVFTDNVTASDLLIRFIAHKIDSDSGNGQGNIHINALKVDGSVSAIPEPTTASVVALGAAGLILGRRRRRA